MENTSMSVAAIPRRTTTVSAWPRPKLETQPYVLAAVCVLVLWSGILAFYGLDAGFLYRTEALRALVARNMLHSGEYLIPTLYGEPLLTKGPVMYAAIAIASWPVGEVTTWTARIPAAVAMVCTALLVFWHLQRYAESGPRGTGEAAREKIGLSGRSALAVACMVVCNPMWLDKGTSAEIDMLVVFWVALALLCFFRAVDGQQFGTVMMPGERHLGESVARQAASISVTSERAVRFGSGRELCWWVAALLAVAMGTLTKWHAPVFFYATAITYLGWTGRIRKLWQVGHLCGVMVAAGFLGVWVLVVVQRVGWEVLWQTLWEQALPRLSPAHQHGERLWLEVPAHPWKMLICGMPWSLFAGLAFWRRWYEQLTPQLQSLVRTLHCWTWPSLVIFTLLPDHDSRHSMPLLTGWVTLGALVCVMSLSDAVDSRVRRWVQAGLAGLLSAVVLFMVWAIGLTYWRLPAERWPVAIALWTVALLILILGGWAIRRQQWKGAVASLLILWLVGKIAFVELVVPNRSVRDPVGKAHLLKQHIPAGETLYIFQAKDEGIMFYYGGPVLRVRGWQHLPQREHVYCLASPRDFSELEQVRGWRIVWQRPFTDEQGEPMHLVLLQAS
jgi:4-amino-4-deoxy-L-arabinose transferase-like glycosyltransferase